MSPRHSISFCPVCGGGLCGIRFFDASSQVTPDGESVTPHGLVICDECEAIWMKPDVSTEHVYADLEAPVSPISGQALWGEESRWASQEEIIQLGWQEKVDPDLDYRDDEPVV